MADKPANYEWLKEFEGHLLWQTTLVDAKFWTYNNNRTTRVVDTLTKKVLAETTLLTLKEIRKALKLAATILRCSCAATTACVVIDKSINGFLKHALFVAADDFWSVKIDKLLQAVVTVDDAAIKIVKVGGSEAATGERNHWT